MLLIVVALLIALVFALEIARYNERERLVARYGYFTFWHF